MTCTQRGEDKQDCTRTSVVYESICSMCNPSSLAKGELREQESEAPSLYVGETSRSIQERALEHLGGARRGVERNHMIVHQHLEHPGEPPSFVFKVISSHKTALNRQIKEAVRIRRRGGAARILNARGEFNRSHITRLVVEQEEEGSKQERLHLEQVE